MTGFRMQWLRLWCLAVMLFGVVLMTGAFPATDALVRWLLSLLGGEPVQMTPALRFAMALMGAVTLGWGLTLRAALSVLERSGPAVAADGWRGLTVAVTAWFVIDSLLSITTGFALNVVPNTLFILAWLVPLWSGGLLRRGAVPA